MTIEAKQIYTAAFYEATGEMPLSEVQLERWAAENFPEEFNGGES